MEIEKLVALHPALFHMADARNWESIRQRGLLSTSALLDLCKLSGEAREKIEAEHRPTTVALASDAGEVWVRDQHPLNMDALAAILDDVNPEEWLRILNSRVFFWPSRERLEKMLAVYAREPQAVFEIDTRGFVEKHAAQIEVSRINSGFASTRYKPARRGRETFVPFSQFEHSSKNKIAEVTVLHSVPDIFDFTTRVALHHRGHEERVLWEL